MYFFSFQLFISTLRMFNLGMFSQDIQSNYFVSAVLHVNFTTEIRIIIVMIEYQFSYIYSHHSTPVLLWLEV